MLSLAQSQEWFEKKWNLASFTMSESWLKASAQLGLSEVNQMGVPRLLELVGPSCMTQGEVSSIDVLSCSSSKGCHFFGHGDCLVTGLGEATMDVCSSAGDVLAGGAYGDDEGDHPKMW